MQAVAEAVVFGQKAGLDRRLLLDVLAKTAVIAPALAGKLERVANNDYSPQFPLQLMNKDFGLILKTADAMKVRMPATEAAFQANSAELRSQSGADFSVVVELMEKLASLRLWEKGGLADSVDADAANSTQMNYAALLGSSPRS